MAVQPAECNIKVVCRFRPMNESENRNGTTCMAKFLSDNCVKVQDKAYTFDRVFQPFVDQKAIYEVTAKPLVNNALAGYNATIFAYGQTSSGKTYTMEGIVGDSVFQGVIPRAVEDIFSQVSAISAADSAVRFMIKVSYLEIYMERVRDLLDGTKSDLEIREDRNRVPYVKGCTEREVNTAEQMMTAFEDGKAIREIGATNMNERSSRSHSMFLIKIMQEQIITQKKLTGKLCLVDLAGSEKVSKTGADGKQLDEAKCINKSLSMLRKVIFALANRDAYIAYRDSKLTRVLQESLGGNAKTTVIVCCSPSSYNLEESKSTLLFGVSAKTIKNVVTVNEEMTNEELKRLLGKERETLRQRDDIIKYVGYELEKWRNGDYVPRSEWVDINKLLDSGAPVINNAGVSIRPNIGAGTGATDMELDDDTEDGRNQHATGQVVQANNIQLSATFVAEKALLLTKLAEAECEKDIFQNRLEEIKSQLNTVMESMEDCSLDETPCMPNPVLDTIRDVCKKLNKLQKNDTFVVANENGDGQKEDDDEEAEDTEQITFRQDDINRQMEQLLQQIKDKESLITQTVANADNIEKMQQKYEVEVNDLNQKIELLERERNEIKQTLDKQSKASKVSETRRIRLQELEKQLAEYRRKLQDLQKLEKLKVQNEQTIKTLRTEVYTMKNTRVKLMRQMRDDNERYRKGQQKIEHEMNQLRQKGKRQQYEVEIAKQNMDKQLNVYRRKYEEVATVNKRLQHQLEKQAVARIDRFASIRENGKLMQDMKEYLKDELSTQVSVEEACLLLKQLEQQRQDLIDQKRKLERDRTRHRMALNGGPSRKKANVNDGDPEEDSERVALEISAVQEELENRVTQIDQLKSKIDKYDPKARDTNRWANLHTIAHAQCALKLLFQMAVDANIDKLTISYRLMDAEARNDDLTVNVARLEENLQYTKNQADQTAKQNTEDFNRREREHQIQVSCLLRYLMKVRNECQLDEEEMSEVKEICKQVKKVENLSEQLEVEAMRNKQLMEELVKTKVRSTGKKSFFHRLTPRPIAEEEDGDSGKGKRVNKSGSAAGVDVSMGIPEDEEGVFGLEAKRRSSMRPSRRPVRYGLPVDPISAIDDPNSPADYATTGRHRKRTKLGNESKNKSQSKLSKLEMVEDEERKNDSRDSSSSTAHEQENSDNPIYENERTFLVDSVKTATDDGTATATRPKNEPQSESDSDQKPEYSSAVQRSPLDNLGISKPFNPRGSLFKGNSTKTKFFQ